MRRRRRKGRRRYAPRLYVIRERTLCELAQHGLLLALAAFVLSADDDKRDGEYMALLSAVDHGTPAAVLRQRLASDEWAESARIRDEERDRAAP